MKKIITAAFILATLCILAQPHQVGHVSINFKDVTRSSSGYAISGGITTNTASGRNVGTEVYYPATTAGDNVALANGQFPIVVFGHGFVMTYDAYDNIYNRLASLGYIVLMPRTEGSFSPSHSEFGNDLKFLASAGMGLNSISNPSLTIFNGKVLQKSAIGGHSMGAGSSFLATASNSTVTCLFNMCAATTNPSSINSASLVTLPTLMISGEQDNVADTTVQNSHYNATASSKKFHVIVTGAKHCDFGNGTSGTCTFGQPACSGTGCNAILFSRYMSYLEPFLANQLKNDCAAGNAYMNLIQNPSTDRAGVKITGSIACLTTGIKSQDDENPFTVFPNPSESKLQILHSTPDEGSIQFKIYDMFGKLIIDLTEEKKSNHNESYTIDIETLNPGAYNLIIKQNSFNKNFKIMKL
jgi:dienelactone hydrolase